MHNSWKARVAALLLLAFAAVYVTPAFAAGSRKLLAGSPYAPAINDTITNAGAIAFIGGSGIKWSAESTGVFNCDDMNEILIYMRVIPIGGDTTSVARFAMSFKSFARDSGRVMPDSMMGVFAPLHSALGVGPDSLGLAGAAPAGTGVGTFPGEWIETFNPTDGRGIKSNQNYGFTTRVIPLSSIAGNWWKGGMGQVRIRLIGFANSTLASKPKVQLWVEGIR